MVRKIAFIVTVADECEMVIAYKLARQCNPDLKIGEAIASMREAKPLLDLETDSLEALNILDTLVEFAQLMKSKEISFALQVTEKCPSAIKNGETAPALKKRAITLEELIELREFESTIAFRGLPLNVEQILQALDEADWFAHVGEFLDDESAVCVPADHFDESTDLWLYAQVERGNKLMRTLCYEYPHMFRNWNLVCESLLPRVESLIARKKRSLPLSLPDTQSLWQSIQATITAGCVEAYFCEAVEPSHGMTWLNWLIVGRIPCGWEGRFPSGRLMLL